MLSNSSVHSPFPHPYRPSTVWRTTLKTSMLVIFISRFQLRRLFAGQFDAQDEHGRRAWPP